MYTVTERNTTHTTHKSQPNSQQYLDLRDTVYTCNTYTQYKSEQYSKCKVKLKDVTHGERAHDQRKTRRPREKGGVNGAASVERR